VIHFLRRKIQTVQRRSTSADDTEDFAATPAHRFARRCIENLGEPRERRVNVPLEIPLTCAIDAQTESRWSLARIMALGWLLPARMARGSVHISMPRAFLLHLFAAVVTLYFITWGIALADFTGEVTPARLLAAWARVFESLTAGLRSDPTAYFWGVAGIVVLIEVTLLIGAFLLTPWGARDEPVRASVAHALRQVWLRTTHLIPIVIIMAATVFVTGMVNQMWTDSHPLPTVDNSTTAPTLTSSDPGLKQAQKDYLNATAQRELQIRRRAEWHLKRPWYVEYHEPILVHTGVLLWLWFCWGLLRAVGVEREVAPIERPPTCEFCGYNLSALPIERRCPECGEPAAASIGAGARPARMLQRLRAEIGFLRAWWRVCADAIRRPDRLGRQLRLCHPDSSHRFFLLRHVPIFFVCGLLGWTACRFSGGDWGRGVKEPLESMFIAGLFGYFGLIAATEFILFSALVVGLRYGREVGRNVMPGSAQIAAYLSGYVALWMLFAGGSAAALITMVRYKWFEPVEEFTKLDESGFAMLLWTIPNLALLVIYFALLGRGTAAMRYANK